MVLVMVIVFWKIVNKVINDSDIILEVLDARFPEETRNLEIEKKIKRWNKKIIYVLNKADLLKEKFEDIKLDFSPYVFVSAKNNLGTTKLRNLILDQIKSRPVNIGIVGYPNTGKSSLINVLKQRKSARTSPTPGFTKGLQKIKIQEGIYLLDTPGVIPFQEKNEVKHALINIKDYTKIKDPDIIAYKIIEEILRKDKKILEKAYDIKVDTEDPQLLLERIALKLNWLLKGGKPNIDQIARRIISDFQRGKIVA